MNLFSRGKKGRRKVYFRGPPPPLPPMEGVEQRYIRFVRNEFMTEEEALSDFRKVRDMPEIRRVALEKEDDSIYLVADIGHVTLFDPVATRRHDIGHMIVALRRHPNPEVRFFNLTRVIHAQGCCSAKFHHPHVAESGIICSKNVELILQEIAAGNIPRALELALAAIYSYGPGLPMYDIQYWPLAGSKET